MTEVTDAPEVSDDMVWDAFPGVPLDRDNFEHYRGLVGRRLLINRCSACGYWIYPHRPMCPECWSWDVVPTEVSGRGAVFMFTLIHQSRDPNVPLTTPEVVAAVELVERPGLRYLSRIVNCAPEEVTIDMPVRLVWIGDDTSTFPAFEPAR